MASSRNGALLLLLAIGLVVWLLLPTGRDGAGGRVDPAPYRAEIEAIEAIVYADEPGGDALELATRALSERLGSGGCARDLVYVGANAGAESDVGVGIVGQGTRDRWIWAWEEWSARCLEGGRRAVPDGVRGADLVALADQMDALVAEARREERRFGEDEVTLANVAATHGQARLEDWRAWAEQFAARAPVLPEAGTVPEPLRAAWRPLSAAARLIAEPPRGTPGVFLSVDDPAFTARYLPSLQQRRSWLDNVERWTGEGRELIR